MNRWKLEIRKCNMEINSKYDTAEDTGKEMLYCEIFYKIDNIKLAS